MVVWSEESRLSNGCTTSAAVELLPLAVLAALVETVHWRRRLGSPSVTSLRRPLTRGRYKQHEHTKYKYLGVLLV